MIFIKIFMALTVTIGGTKAMKVNVEGSVSLGREVMDTISYYMNMFNENRRKSFRNTRRLDVSSVDDVKETSNACKGIEFCNRIRDLVDNYVVLNQKSLKLVFDDAKGDRDVIFRPKDLQILKEDVKVILDEVDTQPGSMTPGVIWLTAIKKITARYQSEGLMYINKFTQDYLNNPETKIEIDRNLTHALVSRIAYNEASIENSIFTILKLKSNREYYIYTSFINDVLLAMEELSEDRTREFLKSFYECLYFTKFNSILKKSTAKALSSIVMDATYTDKVLLKNILSTVHKTANDRLSIVKGLKEFVAFPQNPDVQLLQTILSDLDHMLMTNEDLFMSFLEKFKYWIKEGGEVEMLIKQFLMDMKDLLNILPEVLLAKLSLNTKVFLEFTVE